MVTRSLCKYIWFCRYKHNILYVIVPHFQLYTEKELKKEDSTKSIKQEASEVESKLNSTSALIGNLEKSQNERMSRKPPPHISFTPGPSDRESEIAEELTQQLLALTSKVRVQYTLAHLIISMCSKNPNLCLKLCNFIAMYAETPWRLLISTKQYDWPCAICYEQLLTPVPIRGKFNNSSCYIILETCQYF